MKIVVVGGGPAGLYFALLHKKRWPADSVTVYERNRPDDTFGFGIVLSDETLANLALADDESQREIRANFAYWDDLYVHFKNTTTRSTGHGFCGLERLTLLRIIRQRAVDLGVEMRDQHEVKDVDSLRREADLVVASDGINSMVRTRFAETFIPDVDERPNRFVWLGATLELPGFTYFFKENSCGIWNVHAYQYRKGASTIVVETTEETFAKSGLVADDEASTTQYLENLLSDFLKGHRLITNRSVWRNFPMVRCARWSHENVVLLGDAAHTAHYSIGSGTKLALEDAIALAGAVSEERDHLPRALARYETTRREDVEKIQHAADVSLRWFEHVARVWSMDPVQFGFSLLSRSKQITYENLRLRDPDYVAQVETWFNTRAGDASPRKARRPRPPIFLPLKLRELQIENRLVISPMCQYSARDGMPNDWHLVHLGARATGGAGLVVTEMTSVTRDGRISPGCTGMYKDSHLRAWRRIVKFVHRHSKSKIALQLGHAGRKGSTQLGWEDMDKPLRRGNWPLISASPIPYFPESQVPREMTLADMSEIRDAYVRATVMAVECGFDMIEIHMAHGYLLASFISPFTNRRGDEYGGTLQNRMRFPLEILAAVRAAWPAERPISVRISATDWIAELGLPEGESVLIAALLKQHGCDLVDVSTGQTAPDSKPVYGRMYQTPFAEQIRLEVGIPTIAVGSITTADQCNTIVAAGRADLCALARPHLSDPSFALRAAAQYETANELWPKQYLSAQPQLTAQFRRDRAEAQDRAQRLRELQSDSR
jgi:anthraniloyl-CoA monooxygenase